MAEIGRDIAKAKTILESGGLVAIPTETVYGLAANGLNAEAVAKVFEAKRRPSFDPLILHTPSLDSVKDIVSEIPAEAETLANRFWPGPLTMVLPKKEIVPDLVTSGLESVAVRVPNHQLTNQLLKSLDFPVAAPSANPFGYISPVTAQHVNDQLGDRIDYILDGGECTVGLESTIVSLVEAPTVLRLGGLSLEAIREVIPSIDVNIHSSSKPSAPGMLESHYAPKKSIELKESFDHTSIDDFFEIGALVYQDYLARIPKENQFVLSSTGNINEAAQRLFTGLRALDVKPTIKRIITEFVPDEGLGRAINDRLKRATA